MPDFNPIRPMNSPAISPMARTEKMMESIDQKLDRILALMEKREANRRH